MIFICISVLAVLLSLNRNVCTMGVVEFEPLEDPEWELRNCPKLDNTDMEQTEKARTFCEQIKDRPPPPPPPPVTVEMVKVGWQEYHFSPMFETYNWYGAMQYCAKHKLRLVTYETEDELFDVNQYIVDNFEYTEFWTSATDLEYRNGTFLWMTSGDRVGYWADIQDTIWKTGETFCVVYNYPPDNMVDFLVARCEDQFNVICER